MIDLHSHVLPGIDDGAATLDESLALARAALGDGTTTLLATPHVSRRYRNDPQTIGRLVDELNSELTWDSAHGDGEDGVHGGAGGPRPVILGGAEIAATWVADVPSDALARLGLGGSRWLLIEPPVTSTAIGMELVLADLHERDHRVLLAHPERCSSFHRDPGQLEALVDAGALTSVTAGSLNGRFGASVRSFAVALAEAGMMHNVASDAHNLRSRPPGMRAAIRQAKLGPIADWLTQEVPAAILQDREVPPQPRALPRAAGRRRWWRRP